MSKVNILLSKVNICHSTIKLTVEYSKKEVNFLDVHIKLINGELKTNLFVKPTDTHQFLDPTSCHPYHYKEIPYSQALRLNRICSDNENFDRRYDLEKWLMERGYNEKIIRKQILRKKQQMSEKKLTFNITYYPAFQNARNIMKELYILSTNKEPKTVFPNAPVAGFQNGKSLMDYLLRTKLSKFERVEDVNHG